MKKKEKKKKPEGVIILQMCTKNDNDDVWFRFFLLFWTIFCPFTPLTT